MSDEVDGWIAQLMQCKPLSETEVKKLCDKVSLDRRDADTVMECSDRGVLLGARGW